MTSLISSKVWVVSSTLILLAAFLPYLTFAQDSRGIANSGEGGEFGDLLSDILTFTNDILIPFIIGIGFLVFVWGMFQYFIAGGANDDAKDKGKSLMIYATLGFVLIIIFWGVITLIATSTGLNDNNGGSDVVPNGVDVRSSGGSSTNTTGGQVI